MAIGIKYSVKARDIEEARSWVEEATGMAAEARESSFWGGDYYAFAGGAEEEIRLIKNVDIHDGTPIVGSASDWKIALLFNGPDVTSPVIQALARRVERFEKISETEY